MKSTYCIGVDFGTDSVRTIIVNTADGVEVASAVYDYSRWRDGHYCIPSQNQFRQHPQDYIDGLEATIQACLVEAGDVVRAHIVALSVDTTGSTPVAVNEAGIPLALLPHFQDNPNAMFVLWKDHTAVKEAAAINAHARQFDENYLKYVGGIYSSEWYWAKLLHVFREDEEVRQACYSWVEHCDWIPFLLTGGEHVKEMKRGVCTAGHKGLWATDFDGLPPKEFFASLDPLLVPVYESFPSTVYTADQAAGQLSKLWAERLGLSEAVRVGIGAMDAHMGAVGGQIEPYYLSKVMGTSTCDMLVVPTDAFDGKVIKGICGQVQGSIIPGMIGLEAGQSAFGDIYAWFKQLLSWPFQQLRSRMQQADRAVMERLIQDVEDNLLHDLSKQASLLPLAAGDELSIDWLNGRRTPDANQLLKGAITDLSLGSDAPKIFRSLVEATCFGARRIVERFQEEGVPVKGLIGVGGIAQKSPFVMQMLADVLQMPLKIHRSEQTCALGAAMFAATVAGLYPSVQEAMQAMGRGFDQVYHPNEEKIALYNERYQRYIQLGALLEGNQVTII